jgi:hypothetical protein
MERKIIRVFIFLLWMILLDCFPERVYTIDIFQRKQPIMARQFPGFLEKEEAGEKPLAAAAPS